MDKSKGQGGGSSKEQLDQNDTSKEEKTDNMEQNPNVQLGVDNRDVQNQRNMPQGPNLADQIGSSSLGTLSHRHVLGQCVHGTRPVASSSHGTMSNKRNVLSQSIDGTQPVVNSMSSSLGTMLNQRNVLGQGIDGTRPVVNSMSSSLETMLNQRNVLGQGIDGTRPVVNSPSSNVRRILNWFSHHRNMLGEVRNIFIRCQLPSSDVDQVMVSTQGDYSHTTSPPNNQYQDPIQLLNNMSFPIPPYVPRGVHEHNMRIQSRPYMYVITRGPPVLPIMVPPRVEMRPPIILMAPPTDSMRPPAVRRVPPMVQMRPPVVRMVPPMMQMRPPVIQMVPPMVQMRPPVVRVVPPMVQMHPPVGQTNSQRGYVTDPASPSTNINMSVRPGGEHGGGIQQGSNSDEATSQRRRPHDDEPESSSRDAKRSKR